MFKKKFNKVEGETRECKECKNEFHTFKATWYCKGCHSKIQFDREKSKYGDGILATGRKKGLPYKKPYPFSTATGVGQKRFNRIKRELNQCWTKEERRAHYDKQLKEIEANGILEWIMDRRDDESMRITDGKSNQRTRVDYPNTRGYYED